MTKRVFTLLLVVMMLAAFVPMATASNNPSNPVYAPAQEGVFDWLTACEEDLSGQTLTFFHFGDISGPFGPISSPLVVGFEDAVTLLNANGGLCGATVALENRDTGGAQEQSQAFYDEFSSRDDVYALFLYASADGELLREQAIEDNLAMLIAAGSELAMYGEDSQTPGNNFAAIPLYADQLGAFCGYVAENWASFGIEGDPVIGHLSWEGAFGRSSDTEGTRAYCESVGVGYAGAEYFLPGSPDISTPLTSLLDNGATIIYTTSLASGPAQVVSTLGQLELRDQVLVGGSNWALDTSVIALGGANSIGVVGNLPYLFWDDLSSPAVRTVLAYWAENRLAPAGDSPQQAIAIRNVAYITAFGVLDMWVEAMIRTINEVGFENLSREAFLSTMENLQYDAFGGLLLADFTNGQRATRGTRIGQIQPPTEGQVLPPVVALTDFFEAPDLRVGGEDIPE